MEATTITDEWIFLLAIIIFSLWIINAIISLQYLRWKSNLSDNKQKRILILFLKKTEFVSNDIKILSKHFNVTPFQFSFLHLYQLIQHIRTNDIIYIWFASYHALITSVLTNKPKIVVAGGYDVANEHHYGLASNPLLKQIPKFVFKHARHIISVSETNRKEIQSHYGIDTSILIYNDADTQKFIPNGPKKNNLVITIGYIDKTSWKRKGINHFVKVADEMPYLNFIVAGKISSEMKEEITHLQTFIPNLTFLGYLSDSSLISLYQEAKVYCQLSIHEAFGISVIESMLCECVPVVSNRGALPEIIGSTGFIVPQDDIIAICDSITKAMEKDGKEGRNRVIDLFSLQKREEKLVKLINDT